MNTALAALALGLALNSTLIKVAEQEVSQTAAQTGAQSVQQLPAPAPAFPIGTASNAVQITNGPVVETVTDTTAQIAWSTNVNAGTTLHYGTDPSHLDLSAGMPWGGLTHRVTIKDLQPNTRHSRPSRPEFQASSSSWYLLWRVRKCPPRSIHIWQSCGRSWAAFFFTAHFRIPGRARSRAFQILRRSSRANACVRGMWGWVAVSWRWQSQTLFFGCASRLAQPEWRSVAVASPAILAFNLQIGRAHV